jgi:hypothetical protein
LRWVRREEDIQPILDRSQKAALGRFRSLGMWVLDAARVNPP